jgi:hypothetical protein
VDLTLADVAAVVSALPVVLCVHSLIERLERDEEVQELAFFQQERDAIEQEFELRMQELREALSRHSAAAVQIPPRPTQLSSSSQMRVQPPLSYDQSQLQTPSRTETAPSTVHRNSSEAKRSN